MKNFFTTPATAYPLYSSIFFNGSPGAILLNCATIYYYYYIEPDFLNIPSRSRKFPWALRVLSSIPKCTGNPFWSNFYFISKIHEFLILQWDSH